MSKGSRSRISNKKVFDENFDEIFRKGKKKKSEPVEVEVTKNQDGERVTRYHFTERKKYKKGEAPAIGGYTSTAEKSLSNL